MNIVRALRFAGRFARREAASGELTLLALALFVAVCAMSAVGFFSDRVTLSLTQRASQLLAADLVVVADAPLPAALYQEAGGRGLLVSDSMTFPSMAMAHGQAVLASIKAVDNRYPLRGQMVVRSATGRLMQDKGFPPSGTVWADRRLMDRLGIRQGEYIAVGTRRLCLSGEIVREPDGALDFFNVIPQLMINRQDLVSTGLVQPGVRARWRMMVAGTPAAVGGFSSWLQTRLPRGARIENVEESRPEVREALNRARRFLGLTAMLTVVLSAAAVALTIRRYLARHWQSVAVLRCLGMTSAELGGLFAVLFVALALVSGLAGTAMGFVLQSSLTHAVLGGDAARLPPPGNGPWLTGPLSALIMLAGLAAPPLMAVRRVSPLAVLREALPVPRIGLVTPMLALGALLALAAWQIAELSLVAWLIAGVAVYIMLAAMAGGAILLVLRRLAAGGIGAGWRLSVVSLSRRPWLSLLQVVALSAGLMALLTLTVVRGDLIGAWQSSLPMDAPNQFAINVQPGDRQAFLDAFAAARLPRPELSPLLRARLAAINGKPVRPENYPEGEARRLAGREFNLSWRDALPPGNRILAGNGWLAGASGQFSVERGLARQLGIALGDRLTFDVNGVPQSGTVTSVREVRWDSFQVNFFVLASPGDFRGLATSLVTSFYLPPAEHAFASDLIRRFPGITLIDVGEILAEVRDVIDRLAHAIEAMFALSLAAGVLVEWSALSATRDERLADAGLLRILGASQRQILVVVLSELLWIGALTGLLAGAGAMALDWLAAARLFNLPAHPAWYLLPLGAGCGSLLTPLAGWPLARKVVRQSPLAVLRNV